MYVVCVLLTMYAYYCLCMPIFAYVCLFCLCMPIFAYMCMFIIACVCLLLPMHVYIGIAYACLNWDCLPASIRAPERASNLASARQGTPAPRLHYRLHGTVSSLSSSSLCVTVAAAGRTSHTTTPPPTHAHTTPGTDDVHKWTLLLLRVLLVLLLPLIVRRQALFLSYYQL